MNKKYIRPICLLIAVAAIIAIVTPIYKSMYKVDYVKKGPGVTEVKMLSDYFADLKGTPGDTTVYVLDSGNPGATIYVAGGTHANEPSGIISAVFLVENAKPVAGKLIVTVNTNPSAVIHTDYMEGTPQKYVLKTPKGDREFRYGSRATSPTHQWPDPDVYIHASSGQKLSGSEVRNLNRAHPGRPDGNMTEKIAYGIAELIRKEKAAISIDLHEASPEYPVINAVVAHDRALTVAAEAVMNLQMLGIEIGLEPSPVNLRGLSHREWGDHTDTLAILMETANPAQGRIRGVTDEKLIVTGDDKMYQRVAPLGKLFVPFDENGHPLSERVARHVTAIMEIIAVYSQYNEETPIIIDNIPDYDTIKESMTDYLIP